MQLRDLVRAAKARSRQEWDHTSFLIAVLHNIHRDAKKHPKAFSAEQFHPHRLKTTRELTHRERMMIETGRVE